MYMVYGSCYFHFNSITSYLLKKTQQQTQNNIPNPYKFFDYIFAFRFLGESSLCAFVVN